MSTVAKTNGATLNGRYILIVEDEPFIAYDLADIVEQAGGVVVGPASSIGEALLLISRCRIDAAILDVNLAGGDIGLVLAALAPITRAIVVHTGAGLTPELRLAYPDLSVITKPAFPSALTAALASSLCGSKGDGVRVTA